MVRNVTLVTWHILAHVGKLTGTPESMAIAVQQGMPATLSTELESVVYMAIKLSSLEPLHWAHAPPDHSDSKFAAMCNAHTFEQKVCPAIHERD